MSKEKEKTPREIAIEKAKKTEKEIAKKIPLNKAEIFKASIPGKAKEEERRRRELW